MSRSRKLSDAARTRMATAPGPGEGSGRSTTARFSRPNFWISTAFMRGVCISLAAVAVIGGRGTGIPVRVMLMTKRGMGTTKRVEVVTKRVEAVTKRVEAVT